jgi:anti-sigma regulatory factor (Ser/Thr protein kinase)
MIFEIESYQTLRRAVEELCAFLSKEQVPACSIFDSKLAVYELLGNVLQHSGGSAKLQSGIANGYVELKILAERTFCPPPKKETQVCVDTYSEHGRGLYLVDSVCLERSLGKDGAIVVKIEMK